MEHDIRNLPPLYGNRFEQDCPDIVREYCRLASQRSLSETAANRLTEILRIAESNGWIDFWLNEADHFLAHDLNLTSKESIHQFENQQAKLRENLEDELSQNSTTELIDDLMQHLKLSLRELQQHLKNRGFDPGTIDGILGPKTHSALLAFQEAHHLSPSGLPDADTREALGLS